MEKEYLLSYILITKDNLSADTSIASRQFTKNAINYTEAILSSRFFATNKRQALYYLDKHIKEKYRDSTMYVMAITCLDED